jgi:hypothetical protein
VARPMPLDAPVTKARWFARSPIYTEIRLCRIRSRNSPRVRA